MEGQDPSPPQEDTLSDIEWISNDEDVQEINIEDARTLLDDEQYSIIISCDAQFNDSKNDPSASQDQEELIKTILLRKPKPGPTVEPYYGVLESGDIGVQNSSDIGSFNVGQFGATVVDNEDIPKHWCNPRNVQGVTSMDESDLKDITRVTYISGKHKIKNKSKWSKGNPETDSSKQILPNLSPNLGFIRVPVITLRITDSPGTDKHNSPSQNLHSVTTVKNLPSVSHTNRSINFSDTSIDEMPSTSLHATGKAYETNQIDYRSPQNIQSMITVKNLPKASSKNIESEHYSNNSFSELPSISELPSTSFHGTGETFTGTYLQHNQFNSSMHNLQSLSTMKFLPNLSPRKRKGKGKRSSNTLSEMPNPSLHVTEKSSRSSHEEHQFTSYAQDLQSSTTMKITPKYSPRKTRMESTPNTSTSEIPNTFHVPEKSSPRQQQQLLQQLKIQQNKQFIKSLQNVLSSPPIRITHTYSPRNTGMEGSSNSSIEVPNPSLTAPQATSHNQALSPGKSPIRRFYLEDRQTYNDHNYVLCIESDCKNWKLIRIMEAEPRGTAEVGNLNIPERPEESLDIHQSRSFNANDNLHYNSPINNSTIISGVNSSQRGTTNIDISEQYQNESPIRASCVYGKFRISDNGTPKNFLKLKHSIEDSSQNPIIDQNHYLFVIEPGYINWRLLAENNPDLDGLDQLGTKIRKLNETSNFFLKSGKPLIRLEKTTNSGITHMRKCPSIETEKLEQVSPYSFAKAGNKISCQIPVDRKNASQGSTIINILRPKKVAVVAGQNAESTIAAEHHRVDIGSTSAPNVNDSFSPIQQSNPSNTRSAKPQTSPESAISNRGITSSSSGNNFPFHPPRRKHRKRSKSTGILEIRSDFLRNPRRKLLFTESRTIDAAQPNLNASTSGLGQQSFATQEYSPNKCCPDSSQSQGTPNICRCMKSQCKI